MEDIYSEGVAGLISSVQRYDPEKSKSFTAYAAMRIRGAILDELRRIDWMPRTVRASAKKLKKTIETLEHSLQRAATEVEIRQALGLNEGEYSKLLDQVRPLSFVAIDDAPNHDGSEGVTMHERISDLNEMNAREKTESREVVDLVRERINTLPELQKKVLSMYYFEGLRLAEIATIFKLDATSATKGCKNALAIINNLEKDMDNKEKTNFGRTKPEAFIERYCSKLNINNELTKLCQFISMKIEKMDIMPENTPPSIAAGVVYFVAQICKLNISKRDVKNVSETSEVTINKCFKKLEKISKDDCIIPAAILKKYNL
jgi:FliA/WhiG family RNA polymerase sigma factor